MARRPVTRRTRVVARVRVGRLRGHQGVAQARLSRSVLRPLTGTEEGRQRDGDQDADDQNDHHQLDEGETFLLICAVQEAREHCAVNSFPLLVHITSMCVLERFRSGCPPTEAARLKSRWAISPTTPSPKMTTRSLRRREPEREKGGPRAALLRLLTLFRLTGTRSHVPLAAAQPYRCRRGAGAVLGAGTGRARVVLDEVASARTGTCGRTRPHVVRRCGVVTTR